METLFNIFYFKYSGKPLFYRLFTNGYLNNNTYTTITLIRHNFWVIPFLIALAEDIIGRSDASVNYFPNNILSTVHIKFQILQHIHKAE